MQDDTTPVNHFGGTAQDQLGTYPIPPSILADDQQTKLSQDTPTLTQPPAPVEPTSALPDPQPQQNNINFHQPEPNPPKKVENSPNPVALHQTKQTQAIPPVGSPEEADNYIKTLIKLVDHDKLEVSHTDLKQFDPSTLQDHYRVTLGDDYEIEVSHSKAPDSEKEFYIILFNQLNRIQEVCVNKNILGYIHLTPAQFGTFKNAADSYLNKKKIAEEHEKFKSALSPIDDRLSQLTYGIVEEEADETDQPDDQNIPLTQAGASDQTLDSSQIQPNNSYDNSPYQPDPTTSQDQQTADQPTSDNNGYHSPYLQN